MTPWPVLANGMIKGGLNNADLWNKSETLKTVICPWKILESTLEFFFSLKLYKPRVCVLVQILKWKLLKVINKVVRETSFPSIPIIKESDGGLGVAYSRGALVWRWCLFGGEHNIS